VRERGGAPTCHARTERELGVERKECKVLPRAARRHAAQPGRGRPPLPPVLTGHVSSLPPVLTGRDITPHSPAGAAAEKGQRRRTHATRSPKYPRISSTGAAASPHACARGARPSDGQPSTGVTGSAGTCPSRPDRTCPISTGGGTRRVQLVRGGGGGLPSSSAGERGPGAGRAGGRRAREAGEMCVRFVRGGAEMCARFAWLPPPPKKQNLIPPPLPLLQASRVQELREFDEYERADSQQVRPKSSADSARAPEV